MDTLLVVEKRADSISSNNSDSMPESSMLSFSLGNNRRSILKPRFSKGVVMSTGIAGTDMSLDELTAHINHRVNGIDPASRTKSRSHDESPLAELDRVWKANAKSGTKVRRNTTVADVIQSMPADGFQTSEQYFRPRGTTHSGEMPAEILSHSMATDADDDDTTALPSHRMSPSPPGTLSDVDSDSIIRQLHRSRLVTDAIAAYNDKAGDCDTVPLTDSDDAARRSSRVRLTGTTTAVAKLITSSRKLHRDHEIAAREMASPASSITEGGMIGLIASGNLSSPRRMRLITDDDTTDARDLHRNLPPRQLEKNKSFYARSTEESNASKPGLLYELIAQRKASETKSTSGSLTMESASSAAAASLESSSPTRRATVIDAKTNFVPSPPTYKRSLSLTSLHGGACSPAASPRLTTGLKMTLVKPDGPNIPLGNNDSENAAAIPSPRTLRALSQREHRKRSVSFSFEIPGADLAPAVSYSSPRADAGRNVDSEPEMYNRKPGLGQEGQHPPDLFAKAKVPNLVVKLPDLDLSKKASVMAISSTISSTNAANCAGPQRNLSLRRTGSN